MADGDDNAYNSGNNDDVKPDDDDAYPDDDGDDVDDNDESPTSKSLNLLQFVFDDIELSLCSGQNVLSQLLTLLS